MPVQFKKASAPMFVTLAGMVTEVKLVQIENAFSPMVFTLVPKVTVVKELPQKASSLMFFMLILNVFKGQSENAQSPMVSTPLPMVRVSKAIHPMKA